MLLLGLLLAGLIHVFISREAVLRWFRREGLSAVTTSAAIGVPMPLCSCSVVPIVAEMRRKGASRSACMSFLITAPETGADSILVTNAFFGPVVAITRPIVSFLTAIATGLAWIWLSKTAADPLSSDSQVEHVEEGSPQHRNNCEDDYPRHIALFTDRDDCYVSARELRPICAAWLRRVFSRIAFLRSVPTAVKASEESATAETSNLSFTSILRHVLRYGFVEIADDILFALLVGIALGGLLYFALPADLMANEYANWLAYPIMVLIGLPLYICASASTPIAAALVAKGVSPGAALVFLMTGPATNTGTIAIIVSTFGARFASIYVAGVIVVTIALGLVVDFALILAGLSISVKLDVSDSPAILAIQWVGAFALIGLVVWRFQAGALKSGFADMLVNLRPVGRRVAGWRRR